MALTQQHSKWARPSPTIRAGVLGLLAAILLAFATLALAARADAYVYWTNNDTGAIGRANLDGTDANQSFITGANHPYGLAVDGAHLYWTNDFGNGTIGRADLDGTGATRASSPRGSRMRTAWVTVTCGSGVAVDGAHVYWVSKFGDPRTPPLSGFGLIGLPAPARSGAPTSTAPAST